MSASENTPKVFEDDSIDIIALLRQLYLGRWLILKVSLATTVFGIVVALNTPNTYTAGATFIPQTGDAVAPSSISGLAALAGFNFSGVSAGSGIPATLYPQIVSSTPFKKSLLKKQISVNDNLVTIADYLRSDVGGRFSLIDFLKRYTIGLPGVIIGALESAPEVLSEATEGQVYRISPEDSNLFGTLESKLQLSQNDKDGSLTLNFSDKDKLVAADVAEHANELLQTYIIDFKNKSAREQLNFATRQYKENNIIYERLQDSLAIFKDQNLNISSSLYQNHLNRLERKMIIASSVVEQLASHVEQAKLQVNKDTPVFTIIQPVTVPFAPSAPNRRLILMIWTFLGLVLSSGYVLVREPAAEILQSIKKGDS